MPIVVTTGVGKMSFPFASLYKLTFPPTTGISVTDQEVCGLESAFCESPTQLLVATDNEAIVLEMCNEASVGARVIGVLEGEAVDFDGLFHIEVSQLKSWLSGQQ